jgi:hypothetical protein
VRAFSLMIGYCFHKSKEFEAIESLFGKAEKFVSWAIIVIITNVEISFWEIEVSIHPAFLGRFAKVFSLLLLEF